MLVLALQACSDPFSITDSRPTDEALRVSTDETPPGAAKAALSGGVRFALQDKRPEYIDLGQLGITSDAVVISGHALLAPGCISSLDEFVDEDTEVLENAFIRYLSRHAIDPKPGDLLLLDMEPSLCLPGQNPQSLAPRDLHRWSGADQEKIVQGYRKRIRAARLVVGPDVKLSLFQVVTPHPKGKNSIGPQIEALTFARNLGLFKDLDYLSPPLYVSFKGDTRIHQAWNRAMTLQGVRATRDLTEDWERRIPVAPVLTFWRRRSEANYFPALLPETMGMQFGLLLREPAVGVVVLWGAGVENQDGTLGSYDPQGGAIPPEMARELVDPLDFTEKVFRRTPCPPPPPPPWWPSGNCEPPLP